MCSPKCGDSSSRLTTFSYASGDSSFTNATTSSGVGGRPVRSNVTRRISVSRDASDDGLSPFSSSRLRMNASIGLRTQAGCATVGASGFCGAVKAQCSFQAAPPATQRFSRSISPGVSFFVKSAGGMMKSASVVVMRATSALASGLPATMTVSPDSPAPNALSLRSSRKPPSRLASSGPWQA
jgi:hypothetical protein